MKRNFVQDYLNEAVTCVGIPLRRIDLYHHCIGQGMTNKHADAMAFGYAKRTDAEPWPLDEFEAWMAERHPPGSVNRKAG